MNDEYAKCKKSHSSFNFFLKAIHIFQTHSQTRTHTNDLFGNTNSLYSATKREKKRVNDDS